MRWPAQSHPAAVSASCSWLPHVHAKSYRASFQFTSPCCKTQAKRGTLEAHVDGNGEGTWLHCHAPVLGQRFGEHIGSDRTLTHCARSCAGQRLTNSG